MKCPRCWAEKAYLQPAKGWRGILRACLLLRPMKCHHCYHKFVVSWFSTIGKQVKPPFLRISPVSRSRRPSYSAQHRAAPHAEAAAEDRRPAKDRPRRADAA